MIYSGYKHAIDGSSSGHHYIPMEWEKQLDWQDGPQVIPSPFKEITRDEYLLKSMCGIEAQRESFSVGMNIPGETEWFGGWSGYLITYHTYGLLAVKMHYSPRSAPHIITPYVGLGVDLQRDAYTNYVLRFFEIGCQHEWTQDEGPHYMFEHKSICRKCGQRIMVDSSG